MGEIDGGNCLALSDYHQVFSSHSRPFSDDQGEIYRFKSETTKYPFVPNSSENIVEIYVPDLFTAK